MQPNTMHQTPPHSLYAVFFLFLFILFYFTAKQIVALTCTNVTMSKVSASSVTEQQLDDEMDAYFGRHHDANTLGRQNGRM
jgi:hypothetical protein